MKRFVVLLAILLASSAQAASWKTLVSEDSALDGTEIIYVENGAATANNWVSFDTTKLFILSANSIEESMLKAVNSPTDEYALTYESTTGDFEWQEMSAGGGTGTLNTIKENNTQVGGADITVLDFLGADFDLAETPDTEIQVVVAAAIARDSEVAAAYQPLDDYLTDIAAITGTQGDILYFNGTDWVDLGYGTAGQFLETQGITANPRWGDPAGSGDITLVGDGLSGEVFTPTGTGNRLYFEGTTANSFETMILGVNPTSLEVVNLPNESGTMILGPAALSADNILIKSDGTGVLTQVTGITVDDSNSVSGVGTLTGTGFIIGSASVQEAELEIIDGATLTTTEINYVDGVTSAIQTQLNAKEAADAAITKSDEAETLSANWVNTANPWADNEVANDITIDLATVATTATTANAGDSATEFFSSGTIEDEFIASTIARDSELPTISDVAYDSSSWDGSGDGATKNALRDKLESLGTGGTVDTSGTPIDNDFAKFTDATTIEGRSYAEVRTDLDLEAGTDFYSVSAADTLLDAKAPLASPALTGTATAVNLTVSGTLTAPGITVTPTALPTVLFEDSDLLGSDEEAAKIFANATTTTDGAEVTDVTLTYMDAGTVTNALVVDGSDNQVEFAIDTTLQAGDIIGTELASTSVTPGSYTLSSITVDQQGRITAASSGSGGSETNSLETTITGIATTEIFIGDGADSGTFAALSGDVTMANTGAVTIAANAVENSMMADDAIDSAEIANGAVDVVHVEEDLKVNVIEWHLNSDILGAAATVPDEGMTFRIPIGVDYDTLTVECDETTHTSMAIDIAYASTRYGTYTDEGTALTSTFTHGATAASPIDVSGYGSLTEGQYVNLRVSTASTGDATMCNASLKLIGN